MAFPLTADGDEREDTAAAVGAAIGDVCGACELALLAALTAAVKRTLRLGAVTPASTAKLTRDTATSLALAEKRAQRIVAAAGVPWTYQPVIPAAATGFLTGTTAALIPAGQLPPSPDLAEAIGGQTAPSIKDTVEGVSARVFRDIPDLYQQAVERAITAMPGGQTGIGYWIPRVNAAQQALDELTAKGLSGFTDRAGRQWDLVTYLEMATRTAVSNAYDDEVIAEQLRAGHDLIYTLTHSTEGSCPLCVPWLGRVLSLTGASTGTAAIKDATGQLVEIRVSGTLGDARAAGFRHPNCRCSWIPYAPGADLDAADVLAMPPMDAEEVYKASQRQRALQRRVRRAAQRSSTAMTPAARRDAGKDLAAARAAAAAHRRANGLRVTRESVEHREHPWRAY